MDIALWCDIYGFSFGDIIRPGPAEKLFRHRLCVQIIMHGAPKGFNFLGGDS